MNPHLPFVEKKMKLGYLYFKQDLIGAATNVFQELKDKIVKEKDNHDFIKENERELNIMYMGWRLIDDGCGGFDIVEGGGNCGAFGCCFGIIVVMAICGIGAEDVFTFDYNTGESGGCLNDILQFLCVDCW